MPLVTGKHMKLNRLNTPMWSGVIAFSAFHCSQRIFFIVDYEPDAGKEKKKGIDASRDYISLSRVA